MMKISSSSLFLVYLFTTFCLSVGEEITWEQLINRNRVSKNQSSEELEDDYTDLTELYSNEDTADSDQNESQQNDQPFIIHNDYFDEESAWDKLINARNREILKHDEDKLVTMSQIKEQSSDGEFVNGSSLAFVFDSTGSMSDELKQVKIGASRIMNAMLEHPDKPIHNYILVPFKDPGIGPVTVTSNHELFKSRLDEIVVFGGGDCPEMSVSAIIKALNVSLPNSYIYVFTDAYAKDFSKVNEALALIQKKQSQVDIVMTDECTDADVEGLHVFEKIATMSSGQVYRLNKSEVIEVLKYVKVSLQPQKVTLLSENKPAPPIDKPDEHQLVVDKTLKEFTVSVSGKNASIDVTDPNGQKVDGPPRLEPLLNLTNVKVVNVKEPEPGPWRVTIGSDSDYTLRSTGLSGVDFEHGFSITDTDRMDETSHRPLKGTPNYILIQPTSTHHVESITRVDVLGVDGTTLTQVNMRPAKNNVGVYKGANFDPPTDLFYLGIYGTDTNGSPIKRVSSTAVTSQLPEKPAILMRHSLTTLIGQSVTLRCHVESLVPFTLQWFKDGYILSSPLKHEQTCDSLWELPKTDEFSEGYYSCKATNVAGTTTQKMYLNVTDLPPRVEVPKHMIVLAGRTVVLNCLVQSRLKYNLQWYKLDQDELVPVDKEYKLKNNSLYLNSVKEEDDGWYVCSVSNKGGNTEGRIHITVGQPVNINIEPDQVDFKTGDTIILNCTADGKPQPNLLWKKEGVELLNYGPSYFIQETNNSTILTVEFADKGDSGLYECVASNTVETATTFAKLTYAELPSITAVKNNLMLKADSAADLKCTATGVPEPIIKWFVGGEELKSNERFEITTGTLKINKVLLSDTGEFSCVAENSAGKDVAYIGIFVGTSPKFVQEPKNKKIEINRNSLVPCSSVSSPAPKVSWSRTNQELDGTRMTITSSGSLRIVQAQLEDAGEYVCTAENIFGKISATVNISVTGLVKPKIEMKKTRETISTVYGDTVNLECRVVNGNPTPRLIWLKNNVELNRTSEKMNVDHENTLQIVNIDKSDEGDYECRVFNVAGVDFRTYKVSVVVPPVLLEKFQNSFRVHRGKSVTMSCPVETENVNISWIKDGTLIEDTNNIHQEKNQSLTIKNLTLEHSGVYICRAVNDADLVTVQLSLTVLVAPEVKTTMSDYDVKIVEGHVVTLKCKTYAVPPAHVEWYKNNEKLFTNDETTLDVMRFVAMVEDTGLYKCIAWNEAGSAEKLFNVTILVPPRVHKTEGTDDEETLTAKAGKPVTLRCDVEGFPAPFIIWQRRGMYIVENTTDLTITNDGLLIILNVTKDSAGAYICDAENLAGITQKIFYLHVNFPPQIIEEISDLEPIKLRTGETFSFPCLVEGFPKPDVSWFKNGQPLYSFQGEVKILGDNTLVLIVVTSETRGNYTCRAENQEGSVVKNYQVEVLTPPSLSADALLAKLEVNEGESLVLTCPTSEVYPPPTIQWIKDGVSLTSMLRERSDEVQMTLTGDHRSLKIPEAHPSDSGNYSCIATNLAGRTDAKFEVDILLTPHFEEFNHVAHRTVLAGGEVVLNCSVSGNPLPQVKWKKESSPVNGNNIPGVVTSLDNQHLIIPRGRIHHSGTYTCTATNKVNSKEREFYVNVIETPKIKGPSHETHELLAGGNVTLECPVAGIPRPVIKWERIEFGENRIANKTFTTDADNTKLTMVNVDCTDDGVYVCMATNPAGTKSKYFNVTVLQPPALDDAQLSEDVHVPLGGNVTLRCKFKGKPTPSVAWIHNGRVISRSNVTRRRRRQVSTNNEEESVEVSLELVKVDLDKSGSYTALASNKAGVVEKNFQLTVVAPPKLPEDMDDITQITILKSLPFTLNCPVTTNAADTNFQWMFEGKVITDIEDTNERKLTIASADTHHSGTYTCVANNTAGDVTGYFNVVVLDPPLINGTKVDSHKFTVNNTMRLDCNSSGYPLPSITWLYLSTRISNTSENVRIVNNGSTLLIDQLTVRHGGRYTCLVSNVAGAAEKHFDIDVQEPPMMTNVESNSTWRKKVKLHRRLTLSCPFTGSPSPKITWTKDGQPLMKTEDVYISSSGLYITILQASPHHVGNYTCHAINDAGKLELSFSVDVVVPAEWTNWSHWSDCSATCGLGQQSRTRICSFGQNQHQNLLIDKSECDKQDWQKRVCYNKECPVNGGWSSWSSWSLCTQSCGRGVRTRYRKCDNPQTEHGGSYCQGQDTEQTECDTSDCPVDGSWSEWSPWTKCISPCDETSRTRNCDNPTPEHNGKECEGEEKETAVCDANKCLSFGKWTDWSEWSSCSASCGTGHRKRVRKCRYTNYGKKCIGDNLQISKCMSYPCTNTVLPLSANMHIQGVLNGDKINNYVVADIASEDQQTVVSTVTSDLLKRQAGWFPYTPFLLTPVSWNTAYETDNAENGNSLTRGRFFSESNVEFATGEGVRFKHEGKGVDEDGTLLVEIEVAGEVPVLEPQASVRINNLKQNYIQTGPNTLYSRVQDDINVTGRSLPYTWNSSIQYDVALGTMPYPVETLTTSDIETSYNQQANNVSYKASTKIEPIGVDLHQHNCPHGFTYDVQNNLCKDIDECTTDNDVTCHENHVCINTVGSYKCICDVGYRSGGPGQVCLDIDECLIQPAICSHNCRNVEGSFECTCPVGYSLTGDLKTCRVQDIFEDGSDEYDTSSSNGDIYDDDDDDSSLCEPGYMYKNNRCRDIDECSKHNNCNDNEVCLNTAGSYKCIQALCPAHFTRSYDDESLSCVKFCVDDTCEPDTMIAEVISYQTVSLKRKQAKPLRDLIKLDVVGDDNVDKTKYSVVEPRDGYRVRVSHGRGHLYSLHKIKLNAIHRVVVEALTYDVDNKLLYKTKFLVFIFVDKIPATTHPS